MKVPESWLRRFCNPPLPGREVRLMVRAAL